MNSNGWAVRLYGDHSDLTFNGKVHDGNQEIFYSEWKEDANIGVFYNPIKKELSIFQNKIFIDTAFTNIEPTELFICLEICHKGYYQTVANVELPSKEEYEDLL
jgi:hypothetical protein